MLIVILLCVVIYALWYWAVYIRLNNGQKQPPLYPGLIPIIGHSYLLFGDGTRLWNTVRKVANKTLKLGGVTRAVFGSNLYYVIADPEDALTAANACLQKHYSFEYGKAWLGDGLITGSGEVWKRHRKLLSPSFSLPVMNSYLEVFNSQARKFVDMVSPEVSKGPFDHLKYLRKHTLETFCMTSFGITGLEDNNYTEEYMDAADQITKFVRLRFQYIWLHSDLIFKWSGMKNKLDKQVKIVNLIYSEVIRKKKEAGINSNNKIKTKAPGVRYKAFLDLLLELSDENALTEKEIREEIDTAIVTGFDTSSVLLCYVMILLGSHPDVQEKLLAEIKNVFPTDRNVEKEDLHQLVYTEAVIKESLRVLTIVPITLRHVNKDVKLKHCTLQAGTDCVIILFGTNPDSVWGKDVDQFRPERWLEPETPAYPSYFLGFGLGKRSCLGRTYAIFTMKTILVHFLRRYKVTADVENLKLRLDFVLKPVSGHEIKIEKRVA